MNDPLSGLIDLEPGAALPLYQQMFAQLRDAILHDRLAPGARLPASRVLARQLGIGRNTVLAAVEQLCAEGFLEARRGSGTHVAAWRGQGDWQGEIQSQAPRQIAKIETNPKIGLSAMARRLLALERPVTTRPDMLLLAPGVPALDRFPHTLWGRCLRRAARGHVAGGSPARGRLTGLGYSHTSGMPALRAALARHLVAARGVRAAPDQIIITSSAQAAIDLVMRALVDAGQSVWLENPGYLGARAAALGVGARIVPVPVDAQGMNPGSVVDDEPAKLIYVTPSHQFPTGRLMPLFRRRQLLEIADAKSAVVLEDDYDSEFQFEDRPVAALQGLDETGRVAYVGSFAKSMLPGIRVGYVVAPPWLAGPLAHLQRNTGGLAPAQVQVALAEFLEQGHFRAHVRRMRKLYQARRDGLIEALGDALGDQARIEVPRGGKQFLLMLPAGTNDRAIAARLNAGGMAVQPLSRFFLPPVGAPGLQLGFASCDPAAMPGLAEKISQALDLHLPTKTRA
ncbi:MAG: MocR-like pyridoxine biosynthesis transcription factor PdxR [Alphaproteobacteria bacterium]